MALKKPVEFSKKGQATAVLLSSPGCLFPSRRCPACGMPSFLSCSSGEHPCGSPSASPPHTGHACWRSNSDA